MSIAVHLLVGDPVSTKDLPGFLRAGFLFA